MKDILTGKCLALYYVYIVVLIHMTSVARQIVGATFDGPVYCTFASNLVITLTYYDPVFVVVVMNLGRDRRYIEHTIWCLNLLYSARLQLV